MARYIKQEMPDLNKDGNKMYYYRMENGGNVSTEQIIDLICKHPGTTLSRGTMKCAIQELAFEMAFQMAEGRSVTLDGIGTFRASLGIKKEKKSKEKKDENEQHIDARSLEVADINYSADKNLIAETNAHCELERAETLNVNKTPYSKDERLRMVQEYLANPSTPYISVAEYAELAKLPKSSACRELRGFDQDPSSRIKSSGKRPHIVYVLREII